MILSVPYLFLAAPIGTITATTMRVLAVVPEEGDGVRVRGMDIFLATTVVPGSLDYWIFSLGTIVGEEFIVRAQYATPTKGMAKGRNPVEFKSVVAYDQDEVIAVQAEKRGSPASLDLCDVVLRLETP